MADPTVIEADVEVTFDPKSEDMTFQTAEHDINDGGIIVEVSEDSGEVVVAVDAQEMPMPWRKLLIILLVIACDGMALNIIAPFVSDMVRGFGIEEEMVGTAAGLLLGAFSLAVFSSGFFLGHFSDTYGRKPMLVMGLFTGVVCTVWFGLSPTFTIALISRLVAGIDIVSGGTNSNIGISKAAISDITSGKSRALSLAYIGGTFSFSRALASAVAGIFTGVLIPGVPLYDSNPYLFPCTIAAGLNAFALVFVVIFLPETLKNRKSMRAICSRTVKQEEAGEDAVEAKDSLGKVDEEMVLEEVEAALDASSATGFQKLQKSIMKNSFVVGMQLIVREPLLRKLILLVMINGFSNGGINLAMILLFTLPVENHGLGFDPFAMGVSYLYFGLFAALFQVLCLKWIIARLGAPVTYRMGVVSLCIGSFTMAYVVVPYWVFGVTTVTWLASWAGIIFALTFVSIGFMTAIPMINSMIANSAPPGRQGLTMGTAQSMSSLLRAIGPALSGVIFSFSVSIDFPFLLFWVLAAGYVACILITLTFSDLDVIRMTTTPKSQLQAPPPEPSATDADEADAA